MALGFQSLGFQSSAFQGGAVAVAPIHAGAAHGRDYDVWTQAEIERERRERRIGREASEVIEQVAREQAVRDELDEVAALAELEEAVAESDLRWRKAYAEALEAYRTIMQERRAQMLQRAREEMEIAEAARLVIAQRDAANQQAAIALLLLTEH